MPALSDETSPEIVVTTIDGGAATGKSSTARGVSSRLNFLHVDTGSHYRALTYLLIERNIRAEESEEMSIALSELDLSAHVEGNLAVLEASNESITSETLRSKTVNENVSAFSAIQSVRRKLLNYQRWHTQLAAQESFAGIVMEGRDIGSVVFPKAPFRFFLEADTDTRIRRRSDEGQQDSVAARDKADSGRKNAPLQCPEGAVRINTVTFSLEEVIDKICSIVEGSVSTTNHPAS
ncbi:MAG: (d)CMP kinase [Verrucomicrobiota bacterium]